MSRSRWFLVLLLLLSLTTILNAQTRVDAGVAIGRQPQAGSSESARVLSGAEVLARRGSLGIHVAGEYADVEQLGATIAIHANLVYRHAFSEDYALLLGAGPTHVDAGDSGDSELTWNAELELARTWLRTDLFARIRHYDYSFPRFRDQPASPSGPAVYLGVRFRLSQTP